MERSRRGGVAAVLLSASFVLAVGAPKTTRAEVHRLTPAGDLRALVRGADDGDTILVAPGTYVSQPGGIWIGDTGKHLLIEAETPGTVIFDGEGRNPILRVVNDSPSSSGIITLRGIIFRGGRDDQFQLSPALTLGRTLTIVDRCRFEDNIATTGTTGGGAIIVWGESQVLVRDSVFEGNAANTEGGAIAVYDSDLIVQRSLFNANRVTQIENVRPTSAGGAIALLNGSTIILESRFQGNLAGFAGGALYSYSDWQEPVDVPRSVFFIENSTFVENGMGPASELLPDPQQGAAIHTENQVQVIVDRSRFARNISEAGGAITGYRTSNIISDSLFLDNRSTGVGVGQGFAGQIGLLSGDLFAAEPNRPSGELEIVKSLILCDPDEVDAQTGGGIFAEGDRNRTYGAFGLPILDGPAVNRAPVTLDEVAILGCDAAEKGGLPGEGGGFELAHVALTMQDVVVAGSDAFGGDGSGGGGRITFGTEAQLDNVFFALNSATRTGGALTIQGSDVDIANTVFYGNQVSSGYAEPEALSYGAALFSSPITNYNGFDLPVRGYVRDSFFVSNGGLSIYDNDNREGPINDLRYDGNLFFETTFGQDVYRDVIQSATGQTPQVLNGLVVRRAAGVPSTDKSQVANQSAAAPPTTGILLALPESLPSRGAIGDLDDVVVSFLVYGWTGGSATLDGAPVDDVGIELADAGRHTLLVDGSLELSVTVAGPIFADGFERGDESRWDEIQGSSSARGRFF